MPTLQRQVQSSIEWVCIDPNEAAASALAISLGSTRTFRDVRETPFEAITHALIATDPDAHADLLSYIIGRVPDIFVEKPAGTDIATLLHLSNRLLPEGSKVQVGFNFRFCAGAQYLQTHIASEPLAVQATFLSRHPTATGLPYPEVMFDWLRTNGVHLIDLLGHLWGKIVVRGARSRSVISDRFLLQVDAEIDGCQASLLLGNWASTFTMQVTAVTVDGTVVRMLDPAQSGDPPMSSNRHAPFRNVPDRLVDLGYMGELGILLGTAASDWRHAASLRDAIVSLEIIEQIRLMFHDE